MNRKFVIILILTFLISAQQVAAASLYLKTKDTLSILSIDTGTENINTIEATISYDSNNTDCIASPSANSIIALWITQPVIKNSQITFAGIIPGGYIGQGDIISISCQAKNGATMTPLNLDQNKIHIYLNDGTGKLSNVTVSANQVINSEEKQNLDNALTSDKNPPEITNLEISKNNTLTENQYLLIFNATDKKSGIASIAIALSDKKLDAVKDASEITTNLPWIAVESPYTLPQAALGKYIYLKATDQAGNISLATLPPAKSFWELYQIYILLILLTIGILILAIRKKLNIK